MCCKEATIAKVLQGIFISKIYFVYKDYRSIILNLKLRLIFFHNEKEEEIGCLFLTRICVRIFLLHPCVPQGRAGFSVFLLYALEVLSRAQLLRVSICAYCT